ncbi:hypothetical protein [Natranaerofaba carboxydovora]|uniref:hypothetical protein n=1 Tax=Natranaerofaba carboxydovora TaxID=2742683 RepID=UPI001F138AE1|nr:hypothetical protein [Natranaerofaba carboxydovora]UMZ73644.1 hypothetical protein ACONDI_01207 [Natranaerofaba carboxydovora]
MKFCKKCKSTNLKFKVKLEAELDVIVDEECKIVKELELKRKGKKYGTKYVCINCGKEYAKISPLLEHVW